MKKIISILILMSIINTPVLAVEFDSSIDTSIRKDYNVEENNLPALPSSVPTASPSSLSGEKLPEYKATGKIYTVKSGTKVNLSSNSAITDRMKKGSKVSFTANYGFTTKEGAIIPAGTIFKGIITDSHTPQITGNGGLVELCIDEIYFNGVMSKITTKISLSNSKKVFLSNIKGKRSYWTNFSNAMTPGRKVFGATQTCASVMSAVPGVNVFSFIPLLGGAAVYVVNLVFAPIIAIFTKGGSVNIPAGTEFEIKIINEAKING